MTTGDKLADGVAVARRGRADAADDGAAARRDRAAGRSAAGAEARERGGDARARRARGAVQDSPSRRRRWCSSPAPLDKRSRMYKLLHEAGDARRVRRARGLRPMPSAGSRRASPRPAWRSSRAAALRLLRRTRARRPDVKRLRSDVDRLLLYALGQKKITRRRCAGDRRAGGAAGRLGDDQRDRGGRRGEALRQLALMLDAGRGAGEDPRSARLAGAIEVSGDRAGDAAGGRSRRCSGPTST